VHNNREFDYGDNAGSIKQRLRKMGYRQMLKHCAGVVAVSEQVKRSLLKDLGAGAVDGKRLHVVANGVREVPAVSADERTVARAIWGLESDEALIVGIGRLTAQKDFASLLQALALLPADARGWRCIIAGEGELQQDLAGLTRDLGLSDRVRLAGLVPDVRGLLAAADIFCLPSRFEGLPLVLLEAMAAGLPVAAFAIDGIADVVTDGVQARLVAPGDTCGLASALGALMADRGERRRLGEAGRLLVGAQYDFNRVILQLEKVYGS
jgi:glycosyltransferase involved in cell wall biosynthesis